MAVLSGPDFITLLVKDLETSRHFYSEVIGLKASPEVRPNAAAFATKPVGFAIRKATMESDIKPHPGYGVLLWFHADDSAALYQQLKDKNVPIVQDLSDGPFGKMFTFSDPDGYQITVHDGG